MPKSSSPRRATTDRLCLLLADAALRLLLASSSPRRATTDWRRPDLNCPRPHRMAYAALCLLLADAAAVQHAARKGLTEPGRCVLQ